MSGEQDARLQAQVDETHPGFTITCQKCGSTLVEVVTWDRYDGHDSFDGRDYELTCQACGETQKL